MDLALLKGEKVMKSWDYGKLKGWFLTKGTYNLTVTNKKIISTYETKQECFREDFDLNDVNGVAVSFKMKRRFFFFKRGALSVSLYTPSQEHSLVGVSAVKGDSWISRIPVIGWFFGGGTKKIKVDVNAAKDVVASLSLLVLKAEESAV